MLNRAIEADPAWSSSRATLGAVLMSDGRLEEAFTAYEGAASLSPDPGTLAILGDLSVALGDERRADAFYDRVEPAASETQVHQDAYRRTLAQYLADHDLEPQRAVELAEVDVSQRSDPFGLDTYAWALYRAGRVEEARRPDRQGPRCRAQGAADPLPLRPDRPGRRERGAGAPRALRGSGQCTNVPSPPGPSCQERAGVIRGLINEPVTGPRCLGTFRAGDNQFDGWWELDQLGRQPVFLTERDRGGRFRDRRPA